MINLSEFHNYVARNQSNICQMTIIQNEKTIINDTWNGYKVDDTVHTMSVRGRGFVRSFSEWYLNHNVSTLPPYLCPPLFLRFATKNMAAHLMRYIV